MKAELVYFIELGADLIIKLILVDCLWNLGLEVSENYTFFLLLFFVWFILSFIILLYSFNYLFFG